ncbi:hypothetical protein IPA_06910 [Ignicoccus pacificus DSM 13166]|uniref:Uncharacterized protein n=1 Tax=Ignicoccus pacificus DSM 13166 TaxID=940294 RepID=A0A977KCY7_9CREN|nr:hypothetical protein IPA_06910 [Ignicoccus pacificus DSM 13166]
MQIDLELPLRFTFADYVFSLAFLAFVLKRIKRNTEHL